MERHKQQELEEVQPLHQPSLITCWAFLLLLCLASLIYGKLGRTVKVKRKETSSLTIHQTDEPADSSTEIRPLDDFDVAKTEPHPYRPWKSGKFVMSMGIQKVRHEEWLSLDNRYWEEQALRRYLLEHEREGVTQVLPEAEAACIETLDLIIDYLTRRFPHLFFYLDDRPDHLHNKLTGMTFKVTAPYDMPPLHIAAQLVMEDLNILMQGYGGDPEQYYL